MVVFIAVALLIVAISVILALSGDVFSGPAQDQRPAEVSDRSFDHPPEQPSYEPYRYRRKDWLMTPAEMNFYERLFAIAGDRYWVFAQVHLDDLLDHRIKGQSWRGALSAIQRKSVDYVLCDRQSMKTVYAVELDDSSHDTPERQERDKRVEQLLASVDLPLVRFRDVSVMTDEQIAHRFADALRKYDRV